MTIAALCAVLGTSLLTFAWNVWPLLDGDAIWFVPPMFAYAKEHRLVNEAVARVRDYDSLGEGRLVYHGFLYSMVVGKLALFPSYRAVVITMGILDVCSLFLWAAAFYRIMARLAGNFRLWHLLLILPSLTGLAAALAGLRGRPEPFVILLLGVLSNVLLSLPLHWQSVPSGLTVGAVATAHPVAALMCGLVWSSYTSCRHTTQEYMREMFVSALFALLAVIALLAWYPFPASDWVQGCIAHATTKVLVTRPQYAGNALYYWMTTPRFPLFAMLLLLVSLVCVLLLRRYGSLIRCRLGFRLSIVLFLAVAYYFAVRVPARNYNLMALIPIGYSVIAGYVALCIPSSMEKKPDRSHTIGMLIGMMILWLSALGLGRQIVVFYHHVHSGLSYAGAKARMEHIVRDCEKPIGVSAGFFPLFESTDGVIFLSAENAGQTAGAKTLVLQQANRGIQAPPRISEFVMTEDHYARSVPRLLGIKCANSYLGYEYAVYFRTNSPPP